MSIRELNATDLDRLLDLYAHLHEHDAPPPDRSTVVALWQRICDEPAWRYFGLFADDALIASCTLSIVPNLTRGCRPYGLIENVVTHADHRRQGHGQRILRHALQVAWQHNCYKVMLLTGRKDENVYRFYESAGFDRHAKQAFIAKPTQA